MLLDLLDKFFLEYLVSKKDKKKGWMIKGYWLFFIGVILKIVWFMFDKRGRL